MSVHVLTGDCRELVGVMAPQTFQTCVTSPPYFGLRDYGVAGQIGLEASVEEYVAQLVAVFREVRRVLADDGTLWLNLGDSYAGKNMAGVPWRVAFALQADKWVLRSDIIWHKPNPMPESVTDRPTKAHEYIFLLAKSERYYYDAAAIAEPAVTNIPTRQGERGKQGYAEASGGAKRNPQRAHVGGYGYRIGKDGEPTRNRRTVWTVTTKPFKESHFATFPPDLIEPCIKAGSKPGDTVLDPFGGAGTTGLVADRLGRNAVLVELNPEYAELARSRIGGDAPMLVEVSA